MSIIPEYILQQVLVRGLRAFRDDSRLLDVLFRTLRQDDLTKLRRFILDNTIDICLNYPDSQLKLPAIAIILKNENEDQTFLGDLLQANSQIQMTNHPFRIEDAYTTTNPVGVGSTSTIFNGSSHYLPPTEVATATTNTVEIAEGIIKLVDPYEEMVFTHIIEGTGIGQIRPIIGIDPQSVGQNTIISIASTWDTVPDDTSKIIISTSAEDEGTGEPSKLFPDNAFLQREGAIYRTNYQIMVMGQNPEITIFLYSIVKSIFTYNLDFLTEQGLMNIVLSGSDFLPRSEVYPTLAYTRSLNMEFQYSFDVYHEIASTDPNDGLPSILSKFKMVVADGNTVDPESGPRDRVLLETEVDIC